MKGRLEVQHACCRITEARSDPRWCGEMRDHIALKTVNVMIAINQNLLKNLAKFSGAKKNILQSKNIKINSILPLCSIMQKKFSHPPVVQSDTPRHLLN